MFTGASMALVRMRIDDPLDAFAVHGACGAWGVLAAGLLAVPSYAYNDSCGLVYGCTLAFASSCVAILAQVTWVAACCTLMFGALRTRGLLRISHEVETTGVDTSKHGGRAYEI